MKRKIFTIQLNMDNIRTFQKKLKQEKIGKETHAQFKKRDTNTKHDRKMVSPVPQLNVSKDPLTNEDTKNDRALD